MFLYSILDVKSKCFGSLAECRTDEEAVRSFLIAIQKAPEGSLLHDFPVDFALFKIGHFDTDTGYLTQDVQPIQLISGLEVIQMLNSGDTCSEVAVQSVPQDSNVVALKSTEEEVNVNS